MMKVSKAFEDNAEERKFPGKVRDSFKNSLPLPKEQESVMGMANSDIPLSTLCSWLPPNRKNPGMTLSPMISVHVVFDGWLYCMVFSFSNYL